MNIIYHSRNQKDLSYTYVTKEALFKRSDVLTLHTAYTRDLYHLISDEAFDQMKKTAYLINASRGPIVSEKALINALKEGEIAGSALDVYEI